MTKLKQPFTTSYNTVEELVSALLFASLSPPSAGPRHDRIRDHIDPLVMADRIKAAKEHLKAEGIDWQTWNPPQPLLVGTHEVTANPDGSVRVGCTTVSRATLEAIVKLSSEAMVSEWPKWFKRTIHDRCMIKFELNHEFGIWQCNCLGGYHCQSWRLQDAIEDMNFQPLTPQQAREILSGNSKDQPK